jgi:hypothetical protein
VRTSKTLISTFCSLAAAHKKLAQNSGRTVASKSTFPNGSLRALIFSPMLVFAFNNNVSSIFHLFRLHCNASVSCSTLKVGVAADASVRITNNHLASDSTAARPDHMARMAGYQLGYLFRRRLSIPLLRRVRSSCSSYGMVWTCGVDAALRRCCCLMNRRGF